MDFGSFNPFGGGSGSGSGGGGTQVNNVYKIVSAGATSDYANTYKLQKSTNNGPFEDVTDSSTINIPKDLVVESGDVKECAEADNPVEGYKVGDKYIDLVLANSEDAHVYVLVSDLITNKAEDIKCYVVVNGLAATTVQGALDLLNQKMPKHASEILYEDSILSKITVEQELDKKLYTEELMDQFNIKSIESGKTPFTFTYDGKNFPPIRIYGTKDGIGEFNEEKGLYIVEIKVNNSKYRTLELPKPLKENDYFDTRIGTVYDNKEIIPYTGLISSIITIPTIPPSSFQETISVNSGDVVDVYVYNYSEGGYGSAAFRMAKEKENKILYFKTQQDYEDVKDSIPAGTYLVIEE